MAGFTGRGTPTPSLYFLFPSASVDHYSHSMPLKSVFPTLGVSVCIDSHTDISSSMCLCAHLTEGQEVKVGEYNAIADVLDLINNSIRFQGMMESR